MRTTHYIVNPPVSVHTRKSKFVGFVKIKSNIFHISGPNGVRDYKAHVVTDYEYIGETVKNESTTTSLKFLSREPEVSCATEVLL